MNRVMMLVSIFCLMLCVCYTAHAECVSDAKFTWYWIEQDAETNENIIMTQDENSGTIAVKYIGRGYMLEGNFDDNNIYYTMESNDGKWEIYDLNSNKNIFIIDDGDVVRVIALQKENAYYIKNVEGINIAVSIDDDGNKKYYPRGRYSEEFERSTDSFDLLGTELESQERRIVYGYTATVSSDGKIAYSTVDKIDVNSTYMDEIIYYTTPNQADIYAVRGRNPAWLNDNVILYINAENMLCMYNIDTETSSEFSSRSGREITTNLIDAEERIIPIYGGYIGYAKMVWKGSRMTIQSLNIDGDPIEFEINPLNFMDCIVRVVMSK